MEYSPAELADMEAAWQYYLDCQAHWAKILHDALWDEDVPWEGTVPRFQYEPMVLDAIADVIGRAYYAGRRSAAGEENAYWQPPASPKSQQRHDDNPPTGSGGEMEEVPDGVR